MIDSRWLALGGLLLVLPVSVENPARPDSTTHQGETRVSLIGSLGNYAVIDRGCEGQVLRTHPHDFSEVAGEIQHQFPSGLTVGVRGGAVRDRSEPEIYQDPYYPYYPETLSARVEDVTYINPSIGIEAENGAIGVGWVGMRGQHGGTDIPFSGHLRAGSSDGPYFKISVMEAVPLYAGGGQIEMGTGMRPNRNLDVYWGLGGGHPYDGIGIVARADYRLQRHLALAARTRLGHSGTANQSAIALGLTYVSTPPEAPRRRPEKPSRPGTIESAWGLAPKRPREEKVKVEQERKPPKPQAPAEYGTYQHVDSLPVLLEKTDCWQPDESRKAGVTGTVTLAALIGEDGGVREVRVVRSIPVLDNHAVECVRQWRFRPAKYRGSPVAYWLTVPVTWDF